MKKSKLAFASNACKEASLPAALSLGWTLGILPKDNLASFVIALVILFAPVRLSAAAIAVAIGSVLQIATIPLADSLGRWFLESTVLHGFWIGLHALPLVPWLGLNNSVILGSVLTGAMSAVPIYAAHSVYVRYARQSEERRRVNMILDHEKESQVELFTTGRVRRLAALEEPDLRAETTVTISRRHDRDSKVPVEIVPTPEMQPAPTMTIRRDEPIVIGDHIIRLDTEQTLDKMFTKSELPRGTHARSFETIEPRTDAMQAQTADIIRRELKRLSINEAYEHASQHDEMLDREAISDKAAMKLSSLSSPMAGSDSGHHWISETMIELVRFKPKALFDNTEAPPGRDGPPKTFEPGSPTMGGLDPSPGSEKKSFENTLRSLSHPEHSHNDFDMRNHMQTFSPSHDTNETVDGTSPLLGTHASAPESSQPEAHARDLSSTADHRLAVVHNGSLNQLIARLDDHDPRTTLFGDEIKRTQHPDHGQDLLAMQPREESLRYLLWHLSGINREKRA